MSGNYHLIFILIYTHCVHLFAPLNILGELLCHKAQGLRIGKQLTNPVVQQWNQPMVRPGYTILRAAMDACSSRKETASRKMCKFHLERQLKLHEFGGLFCCPDLLDIAVSQLCMSAQLWHLISKIAGDTKGGEGKARRTPEFGMNIWHSTSRTFCLLKRCRGNQGRHEFESYNLWKQFHSRGSSRRQEVS